MATGDEPELERVTIVLCSLCLDGRGGECHTPGCALWINRAPDLELRSKVGPSDEAVHARTAKALDVLVDPKGGDDEVRVVVHDILQGNRDAVIAREHEEGDGLDRVLRERVLFRDVLQLLVEQGGPGVDAARALVETMGVEVTDDVLDSGVLWERHGFGVCSRGNCEEPCGPTGGCVR